MKIASACKIFNLTRDAWYKSLRRTEESEMQQQIILNEILRIRSDLPGIGGRKLHFMLQGFLAQHGLKMGRKKLFDLLRKNELLIKRRRNRRITTNSNHPFKKYKNLIKEMEILRPNHVWVSDITYVLTGSQFSYLSLITDAYSRMIMGWSLYPTLQAIGPLTALEQALKFRKRKSGVLYHHSDRGIQYCCHQYTGLLKENEIFISMTQLGDPSENAIAERINGTIKVEFLSYWFHGNFEAAQSAIAKAIRSYNEIRPHESLNYLTPNEVHFN